MLKFKIMKLNIFLIMIFFLSVSFKKDCGVDRWNVKTLSDKESVNIKWTPIRTTVKSLSQIIRTYPIDKTIDKKIRFGYEFNVYEIRCRIKEYRKEDDGDYHLVLVDLKDTTSTIVGEVVNPLCVDIKKNNFFSTFVSAREEFEKITIAHNKVKSGTYTIIGVCFFDKIHNQLGVAPNGIELHPIMDIVQDFRN